MNVESHARPGLGLRLQILLALAGVMLVAYVPLFFAIAQVTRGISLSYREDAARSLGRAIAAHLVAAQHSTRPGALQQATSAHVETGDAVAVAVYGHDGTAIASAGSASETALLEPPPRPLVEFDARATTASSKRAMDVVVPNGDGGAVRVRVLAEDDPVRTAQLVRGTALYMTLFALALLVFAYIALTRAIVRPIEELAHAADRVANGGRHFELPTSGAREVADLGASVRAMTARLLQEEEKLRSKIDELTTTTKRLGETREQLAGSEHMASVGRLAAGVAHEIGNPLAAIMGMHDLIEDDATSSDLRSDFLRRMRKETERIHVVVRDLLDYARPEEGTDLTRPAQALVSEIVDDTLNLVLLQRDFKSIEPRLDLEPELEVMLSPQRLTQVLLNLLLNAGAALAQTPEDHARVITIRTRRLGATVRIEVEDNGPGVREDVATRIFDPFVTTKEVGTGTGLGLAICRGIVEGARGRIFVDPDYTQGARFVIELPKA